MSTCRSCRAEIQWAKTVNGKAIPLDPDPVQDGNLFFTGEGDEVAHVSSAGPPIGKPLYKTHFASCPQSAQHRKRASADETR